ncbi:formin-like protein 5 [Pipra filicauda]|uniref:Formin-like protein 5 n=1 Tax=Pipra filicauda TaxID=649802 RepID=A0A7R5KB57_9PASS|nr:formin-like protein 5 [Pipra filicauda]
MTWKCCSGRYFTQNMLVAVVFYFNMCTGTAGARSAGHGTNVRKMLQEAKLSILGPVAVPEGNSGPGMTRRTALEDTFWPFGRRPTSELGQQPPGGTEPSAHGPEPPRTQRVDVSLSLIHQGGGGNSPEPSPPPAPKAGALPALHSSISAQGPSAGVRVDLTVPGVGAVGDPGGSPSPLGTLGPPRCPHDPRTDCSRAPTSRTPLDWLGSTAAGEGFYMFVTSDQLFLFSYLVV